MNCKVDNSANMTRFRFEPFLYHSDGTETDIFTENVFSPDINNTNYEYVPTNYTFKTVETDPADRFGIRIYMRTNRTSPTALYFRTGDGFASYMTLPVALRHSQLREKDEEATYQHITLEEKERLAAIPSDAEENLIESISVDNTALTISNKSVNIDLSGKATKLSISQNQVPYRAGEESGEAESGLSFSTTATGNTLAKRTTDGRLKVGTAAENDDAVTKTQHDLKLDKKPDGTNDLLSNNKLNTFYIPDTILGQVLYGGSFNATTAATLTLGSGSNNPFSIMDMYSGSFKYPKVNRHFRRTKTLESLDNFAIKLLLI